MGFDLFDIDIELPCDARIAQAIEAVEEEYLARAVRQAGDRPFGTPDVAIIRCTPPTEQAAYTNALHHCAATAARHSLNAFDI